MLDDRLGSVNDAPAFFVPESLGSLAFDIWDGEHPVMYRARPKRADSPHPPQCTHWGTFPRGGRFWGTSRSAGGRLPLTREAFEVVSGDTTLPMRLQSLLGGLSQSGEADIQENQLLAGVL